GARQLVHALADERALAEEGEDGPEVAPAGVATQQRQNAQQEEQGAEDDRRYEPERHRRRWYRAARGLRRSGKLGSAEKLLDDERRRILDTGAGLVHVLEAGLHRPPVDPL